MGQRLEIVVKERNKRPRDNLVQVKYSPNNHRVTILLPYPMTEEMYWNNDNGIKEWVDSVIEKNGYDFEKPDVVQHLDESDVQEMVDYWIDQMKVDYSGDIKWNNRSKSYALVNFEHDGETVFSVSLSVSRMLMNFPERLANYTIAHEICHIYMVEKYGIKTYSMLGYHGAHFWVALDSFLPGARKLDKEFDKYARENSVRAFRCC